MHNSTNDWTFPCADDAVWLTTSCFLEEEEAMSCCWVLSEREMKKQTNFVLIFLADKQRIHQINGFACNKQKEEERALWLRQLLETSAPTNTSERHEYLFDSSFIFMIIFDADQLLFSIKATPAPSD